MHIKSFPLLWPTIYYNFGLLSCAFTKSLFICSASGAYTNLMASFEALVWISFDITQTTVTMKTTAPHVTSYLWQCRYNDINTNKYIYMNTILTLYITNHDNAPNNNLQRRGVTSPWATSHRTTPYCFFAKCALISYSYFPPASPVCSTNTAKKIFTKSASTGYRVKIGARGEK